MKGFDKEYQTQFMKEVDFLKSKNIKYTFVKRNEYGIRTYKYKKTPELFDTLKEFYKNND